MAQDANMNSGPRGRNLLLFLGALLLLAVGAFGSWWWTSSATMNMAAEEEVVVEEVVTPIPAPAATPTTPISVDAAEISVDPATGLPFVRFSALGAATSLTEGNVDDLCNGSGPIIVYDDAGTNPSHAVLFTLTNGILTAGGQSISFMCPLPGRFGDLPEYWFARASEHAMTAEFTQDHLIEMIMVINSGERTLVSPQRLQTMGYTHGDDYTSVTSIMEQTGGPFWAYTVETDGVLYIVPAAECFNGCQLSRTKVLHLHPTPRPAPRVAAPPAHRSAPQTPTTSARPPSGGDPLLFRCSGNHCR